VVPTSFLPLRYLAFSSGVGVISTVALVGILVYSGLATPTSPGSLRDIAPTDPWPTHGLAKALVAVGLLMSGVSLALDVIHSSHEKFGGHGLIPNLFRDMRHPQHADRVVEAAYAIALVVLSVVAICGYLMYGRDVSDEVQSMPRQD
jgi:vesicular inhibitory amino acid transporter